MSKIKTSRKEERKDKIGAHSIEIDKMKNDHIMFQNI